MIDLDAWLKRLQKALNAQFCDSEGCELQAVCYNGSLDAHRRACPIHCEHGTPCLLTVGMRDRKPFKPKLSK